MQVSGVVLAILSLAADVSVISEIQGVLLWFSQNSEVVKCNLP